MLRGLLRLWFLLAAIPLVVGLALTGCGSDDDELDSALLGGACTSNDDCEDRCVQGSDYPDGFCTVSCLSDTDCPSTTYCVDDEGGVCLFGCDRHSDCEDLGPDWLCDGRDRKGAGGEVRVCRGD
jgi:hypothetical protein